MKRILVVAGMLVASLIAFAGLQSPAAAADAVVADDQTQIEIVEERPAQAPVDASPAADRPAAPPATGEYIVGIDDVLDISVLQPEKLFVTVTVAPDGTISFPYVGNVPVQAKTLTQIQEEVQARLSDGFMKYPVVSVALRESRSRKFFVYGEVMRPGTYTLQSNTTVLRAITMAGGFTKFGSSNVKVLRPRESRPGYDTIKVNIKAVMDGNADEDLSLNMDDIVVVSQGVF